MNLSKMIIDQVIKPEMVMTKDGFEGNTIKTCPGGAEKPQIIRRRNDITFLFGQVDEQERKIHGIGRKIVIRTKAGAKVSVDGGLKCQLSLEEGRFDESGALAFGRRIYTDEVWVEENGQRRLQRDAKCLFGQLRGGHLAGEGMEYIAQAYSRADDPTTEVDESKEVIWKAEKVNSGKFQHTVDLKEGKGADICDGAYASSFQIVNPEYLDLAHLEVSA